MPIRFPIALVILAALSGCFAESPMPPGFNEACYGGNFNKTLAGAKPIYAANLTLDHSSEPILRDTLFNIAKEHGLKAFDDGANYNNTFFSVYLCSSAGAFGYVDNRAAGKNKMRVDIFAYKQSWQSDPFIQDLKSTLQSKWPHGLEERNTQDTTLKNQLF